MTSFTEALRAKFATDDEEDALVQNWMSTCGLDKLPSVTMPRQGIRTSGSWDGINLAKMAEVSLPGNELSLSAVVDIIYHLPKLGLLDISGNSLGGDAVAPWQAPPAATLAGGFRSLHTLVLASTGLAWDAAGTLLRHLPALRELSLARNGLTSIDLPAPLLQQLTCLRLEDNGIERWEEVQKLAVSRSLTQLVLSNNPLQRVQIEQDARGATGHERAADNSTSTPSVPEALRTHAGEGGPAPTAAAPAPTAPTAAAPPDSGATGATGASASSAPPFPVLRSLWLSGTRIASFDDVAQLGRLPALRDLRLRDVPLTAPLEEDVARLLLISHLPNVAAGGKGMQTVGSETAGLLNGSAVTRSERWDAAAFRERWDSGEWHAFRSETNPDNEPRPRDPVQEVVKALTRLG
eukprot:jgi/Mesvir1/1866/Mv10500-RA.1